MVRAAPLILLLFAFRFATAQTLGGTTVYNFLKLSNCPQLTGLGGTNISNISTDIGLSFQNPALLRPGMHGQVAFVFNSMAAGIRNYHILGGYHHERWNTDFSAGINYFNYGEIPQTDAAGNILGQFRPVDYAIQLSAERAYMDRWHYGASLKFLHSGYGIYRSTGVAMDLGLSYTDSASMWQAAFVVKNMGAEIKRATGTSAGDLPFDMQLGITKQLEKAPFRFSLTAHHLHQFDIRYNDTTFNNDNGFDNGKGKFFFDKLFRHFVFAMQALVEDRVEISLGYDFLRRKELNIGNNGNGLNGFSLGVGMLFKKWQFRYARTYYQSNSIFNQFGLSLSGAQWLRSGKKD